MITWRLADGAPTDTPAAPKFTVLKMGDETVAHSFSLVMAEELRCENNGGLPAKPVLDPA
ncbi:hypothetical protein [Streptomyces sp. NPDC059575]|uniref:hypothetical protein n=1 Tax=Streptomyces sp. NPDC059575 TaxID=3346872 RepID=UPI0036A417AB